MCALASVRTKGLWAPLDIFHWAHGPNGLFTFYMPSLPGNPIYFPEDFSFPTFQCLRLVQIISSVESSQPYLLPPPAPFSPCAAALPGCTPLLLQGAARCSCSAMLLLLPPPRRMLLRSTASLRLLRRTPPLPLPTGAGEDGLKKNIDLDFNLLNLFF